MASGMLGNFYSFGQKKVPMVLDPWESCSEGREGSRTSLTLTPTTTVSPMSTLPSPSAHATGHTIPSYPSTTTVSFSSSLPITPPMPKIPKVNVFSNDGSFLERFHKLKRVSRLMYLPRKLNNHGLGMRRTNSRRRSRRRPCNGAYSHFHELQSQSTYFGLL